MPLPNANQIEKAFLPHRYISKGKQDVLVLCIFGERCGQLITFKSDILNAIDIPRGNYYLTLNKVSRYPAPIIIFHFISSFPTYV